MKFGVRVVTGFFLCFFTLALSQQLALAATYTLGINVEGSGTVNRNPTNTVYPEGSVVTLTATPATGWFFEHWAGDATGPSNPLNVLMNSNKSITAVFSAIPVYSLTASPQGSGTVTVSPQTGPYVSNSVVTLSATASPGWAFAGWTGDVSGSANPLQLTITSNMTVQAVFAQKPAVDVPPQNRTVEVGESVSFTVQAVGAPPLSYQWWFGATKLTGETGSTYSLQNAQLIHEGVYSVIVSNPFGSVTNFASLTINAECAGSNVVTIATEAALREAIARGGLIRLCLNGTITLTNTIEVTKDVTLDARNRSVVVSGGNAVRLFQVGQGVTFEATNVVFAHGRHVGEPGGASPASAGEGGAFLCDSGTLRLISCVFSNNVALGGAQGLDGVSGDGRGGAIAMRNGSLILHDSIVSSNACEGRAMSASLNPMVRTAGSGFGGAVYLSNATALVSASHFASNICVAPASNIRAFAFGGAMYLHSGNMTLTNSYLVSNAAVGLRAASIVSDNQRPGSAYGGAVAVASGTGVLSHCWVSNNAATGGMGFRHSGTGEGQGGAVYSAGTIRALDSSFTGNGSLAGHFSSENADGKGGAIYNLGIASLDRCLFASNTAVGGDSGTIGFPSQGFPAGHGFGGAVYNSSDLRITNSTFALNSALGGVSRVAPGQAFGGGIYNTTGAVHVSYVTLASNSVTGGQFATTNGIADGANVANASGVLALVNTLLAYPGTNNNAWGNITDWGYNISSDGSAQFNSGASFNFTDPRLLPLADNGGPTLTMALQTNSPALDFAKTIPAVQVDQRGFARASGNAPDVGAYELQVSVNQRPSLTLTRTQNGLILKFEAAPATTYELQVSTTLTGWNSVEVIGPHASQTMVERPITAEGPSRFYRLLIR